MVEGRIEFDDGYYFGEVIYNESYNEGLEKGTGDLYLPHNEGEYTYYEDNKRVSGIWDKGKLIKIIND